MRPVPKYVGLVLLLSMTCFAAVGFFSIRRDVDNLDVLTQDNMLWSATQMEVELLRFQSRVMQLQDSPTQNNLDAVQSRFDILWSRVFMSRKGRAGRMLRQYDEDHGALAKLAAYLEEIDPLITGLTLERLESLPAVALELDALRKPLRHFALRVVRADSQEATAIRNRIRSSAQTTAAISLGAVLLSLISLGLILRENRQKQQVAEAHRQVAEEADRSSRAKSRYLAMMSHELRNPLNGIIGPLALLGQSDLAPPQRRLVHQAKTCGHSMLRMLIGLLDYGELEDGRFRRRLEPFTMNALCKDISGELTMQGAERVRVSVPEDVPGTLMGDRSRLSQIFVHLCDYVLEVSGPDLVEVSFRYEGAKLIGNIEFRVDGPAMDWKLDLLIGLSELDPDQISTDTLRPLIARGLIAANGGVLSLKDDREDYRCISVSIPAEVVEDRIIRVYLETRSEAMRAIYKAALKSERIVFSTGSDGNPVDFVLVDSTNANDNPVMSRLRRRFPGALFVSLGQPHKPSQFDDIVDTPGDVEQLRTSIMKRIIS